MRKILDKFVAFLTQWGVDFYLHMVVTIFIAMLIARVCFFTGADHYLAGFLAVFVSIICGVLKEVYDSKTTKIFSQKDLIADLLGAVLFSLSWF